MSILYKTARNVRFVLFRKSLNAVTRCEQTLKYLSSHVANYYMVEGSPHMCHVWQLTCTLLLYGGGEPSHVAHVCHVWHMWQLICTLLLYGGGEPSRVANVCHMWQLMCMLLLYGGGEPSRVAHMCHMWQLTCTLLLYGGGGPHVWLTCVTCGN